MGILNQKNYFPGSFQQTFPSKHFLLID